MLSTSPIAVDYDTAGICLIRNRIRRTAIYNPCKMVDLPLLLLSLSYVFSSRPELAAPAAQASWGLGFI